MPRAPSRNNKTTSRPTREHKPPVIFNVEVELPTKEKKEPKFVAQRQNVHGLKNKPSYYAMIAKALYECRDPFHGMKFNDICKYIETNYPVKVEYRRFLKLALSKAVEDGAFVQLGPRNYKLATEERRKMKDGKAPSRRKSAKTSTDKKKVTKRTSSKKEDDAKKSPNKRSTKNSTKEVEEKKKSRSTPKKNKRSTKEEKETPKKRKRVGKVEEEEEEEAPKSAKKAKKSSEKSSGGDNTLIWVRSTNFNWGSQSNIIFFCSIQFWQYFHDGWCNYDPKASEVVEATYQEYLRNPGITDVRSVESGEWNYMIDFRQMSQQNVGHEAHTIRRIRRVQIPKKDAVYRKKFPGTQNDKTL